MFFWVVAPRSPVAGYKRFGEQHRLNLQVMTNFYPHLYLENRGCMILLNAGNHQQDYMISQPGRLLSTSLLIMEQQPRKLNSPLALPRCDTKMNSVR
jgi:hypothetical protein